MRRLWPIAGLVLSLAVVLAACGGGATPTPKTTPTPSPAATPRPAPATPPAPAAPAPAGGKELFTGLGCLGCHKINGAGGAIGPSLKGVAGAQVELANGQKVTANDAYIEESIKNPNAKVVKGFTQGIMPAFDRLTLEQMSLLVDFIRSLK
ncbi:MAG: cytochrome c [Chloroflexota bacterium]